MQMKNKTLMIAAIVAIAAITRLIPHPMNFAPMGAMALFGAAYFGKRGLGLLIVMLSWLVSDLIINNLVYATDGFVLFTQGALFIYGSIVAIFFLGSKVLSKINIARVLVGSVGASIIFFTLSNFGVWMTGTMYPMTISGLTACYIAAIPFFQNTLTGDLVYTVVLFLVYEKYLKSQLIESKVNG